MNIREELIAPCGMNCAVCVNYIAGKLDLKKKGIHRGYCGGCIPRGKNCLFMAGKCDKLGEGRLRFCFECDDFPCKRLKALDKRYRTKYHLSMIENLSAIKQQGMAEFLAHEQEKWECPDCGGTISCHIGLCLECRLSVFLKNRKYRWGDE